jgi:hypothetical protein
MKLRSGFNFILKLTILGVSGYGLFLIFTSYQKPIEAFGYFTTQVNILVFLSYFYYLIRLQFLSNKTQRNMFVKQALLVYVLLTMIVYAFVIIPYITNNDVIYEVGSSKDIIIHLVTPTLVCIDYAMFDIKGKFRKINIISVFLFPLTYLLYVYVYVSMGGRFTLAGESLFPYFFLNYEVYGLEYTVLSVFGLFIFIAFNGWLTYVIDEILKHKL